MTIVLYICAALLFITMILGLIRFIIGPGTLNRIIAFDLICICIIGIICLYSILTETLYLMEALLAFCLLGFTSTLAFVDSFFKAKESNDG